MGVLVYNNRFKLDVGKGLVNLETDTIKFALMNNSFVFDVDAHDTYAAISSSELAAGGGYTVGGYTLTFGAATEDDANDRADFTYADLVITGTGGSIGPTNSGIIYDDTHANKIIIAHDPFATVQTIADGSDLTIQNIILRAT